MSVVAWKLIVSYNGLRRDGTGVNFGERLALLRRKTGLSQYTLADKLGMSRGQLANYEQGQREPDFATVNQLAEFFDVTTDYLLGRTSNPNILRNPPESSKALDHESIQMYPVGPLKQIPIVAEIPCGQPVIAEDAIIGYFPVDTTIIKVNGSEFIWVYAKGDSMIDANIFDGSLVLIRLQPDIDNHDIAAVVIDGEYATIKRIYKTDGKITLVPENRTMSKSEYESHRVRIVGKVEWIVAKPK